MSHNSPPRQIQIGGEFASLLPSTGILNENVLITTTDDCFWKASCVHLSLCTIYCSGSFAELRPDQQIQGLESQRKGPLILHGLGERAFPRPASVPQKNKHGANDYFYTNKWGGLPGDLLSRNSRQAALGRSSLCSPVCALATGEPASI